MDIPIPGMPSMSVPSLGILGSPGPTKSSAYLNKDILTSVSSESALASLGLPIPSFDELLGSTEAFGRNSGIKALMKNCAGNISYGVVSISFSRSKNNPDQKCTINIVGPLPSHTRAGSWIIASIAVSANGTSDLMPKFIGQIHTVNTEYNVMSNGAIVLRSTISVSSWSNLLLSPVIFDMRSGSGVGMNTPIMNVQQNDIVGLAELIEITEANINPYEFAQLCLSMVGCLNASAYADPTIERIYRAASSMPEIPKDLLGRLQFSGKDSRDAFAKGLISIITGRQVPVLAGQLDLVNNWDGFFSEGKVTFSDFEKSYTDFADDRTLQPYASDMPLMAQIQHGSIWSLIASNCDPQVNEIYTDIFYEKTSSGFITPKLSLIIRGRPFKTKAAEAMCYEAEDEPAPADKKQVWGSALIEGESPSLWKDLASALSGKVPMLGEFVKKPSASKSKEKNSMYDSWNYYEDIPRITLDSALIVGMNITNTFMSSPTLFTLGESGGPDNLKDTDLTKWAVLYTKRHDAETLRFGTHYKSLVTQYFYADGHGAGGVDWFFCFAGLSRVWDGFNYRTASGVLRIKDPGLPLSVGFNLQFTITGVTYVVHIESIDTSFSMDESGNKTTMTSIQFSRMMQLTPEGSLEFCPAYKWADLWHNAPPTT